METIALPLLAAPAVNSRRAAALSVFSIGLLATFAVALFNTDQAMDGNLLERAVIPARMLSLVLAATLLLRLTGESWAEVGLAKPRSYWKTAALVVVGYLGLGTMFLLATKVIFPLLEISAKTGALFSSLEGDFGEYLYWLIPVAWGSAAVGEELVFRGFLQSRLERLFQGIWFPALLALLCQAFIFGSLHAYQGLGGAVLAGGTGLAIGTVYLAAGRNLWAPIILHGLVDTVTLSAIYFGVAGIAG